MAEDEKTAAQDFSEERLAPKTVFQGKLLHVLCDTVRLPNGREFIREYIRHPGASMIIAIPKRWHG